MKINSSYYLELNTYFYESVLSTLIIPKDQQAADIYLNNINISIDYSEDILFSCVYEDSNRFPVYNFSFSLLYSIFRISEVLSVHEDFFSKADNVLEEKKNFKNLNENINSILDNSWRKFLSTATDIQRKHVFEVCNYYGESVPKNSVVFNCISALSKNCISFVSLHEQHHFFCGHLDPLLNSKMNSIEKEELDKIMAAMEFECDILAISSAIENASLAYLEIIDGDIDFDQLNKEIMFSVVGAAMCFLIFDHKYIRQNRRSTQYPSLECRISVLLRQYSNFLKEFCPKEDKLLNMLSSVGFSSEHRIMSLKEAGYIDGTKQLISESFKILESEIPIDEIARSAMLTPIDKTKVPDGVNEMYEYIEILNSEKYASLMVMLETVRIDDHRKNILLEGFAKWLVTSLAK